MRHQWEAEQVIEPSMALQLIKEQFPGLSPEQYSSIRGWLG